MEKEQLPAGTKLPELVEKYADMVLRLGLAYLKNLADAQDVCQEVFVKLYKQGRPFEDAQHEKAWIIKVTTNACKDVLRSGWKKRLLPSREVVLPIRDTENRQVVSKVLTLPLKYRQVIHLYYFENYSTAEIAGLLNRKEATVRTQLKRAREMLKMKLTGGFDDAE